MRQYHVGTRNKSPSRSPRYVAAHAGTQKQQRHVAFVLSGTAVAAFVRHAVISRDDEQCLFAVGRILEEAGRALSVGTPVEVYVAEENEGLRSI